jgi:hypothetical protein
MPAYAPPGQPPTTGVWSEQELRLSGFYAPACLNWGAGRTRYAVALAGEFQFVGTVDELAARLGRISGLKSVRYWAADQKEWRAFAFDAGLLEGPQGGARPDLFSYELTPSRSFYYFETNRAGRTVYRLTVHERTADRIVVATENVTAIRIGFLTAFEPDALQSVIFLERHGPGLWGYYQTLRATDGSSSLALGGHDASYINHLAAIFRYIAGIPTDQQPPAAR